MQSVLRENQRHPVHNHRDGTKGGGGIVVRPAGKQADDPVSEGRCGGDRNSQQQDQMGQQEHPHIHLGADRV